MENQKSMHFTVKVTYGISIKRFEISTNSTFNDLKNTLAKLYPNRNFSIRYKDEDHDLISMSNEDDFTEALRLIPEIPVGMMRLHLVDSNTSAQTADDKRKHGQSCSSIDQDVIYVQDEVVPPSVQENTFEKPILKDCISFEMCDFSPKRDQTGYRKMQCTSSSSIQTNSSSKKIKRKNDKNRKKRKRKMSSSSSSSSDGSTTESESSSDSSSSEGYRKGKKLKKFMRTFEKNFSKEILKEVHDSIDDLTGKVTAQVTRNVLQQLDGAVIQSISTGSSPTNPVNNIPNMSSPSVKDGVRVKYHHQNVICDVCNNEIVGPRYKCGNCSDYDLCETCEGIEGLHYPSHVFLKINYPSGHCGRKKIGGKSRPLLRYNIYEQREKEREREELLQRKIDSGNELNMKKIERMEKQRIKMREAERTREIREARREEWKKMKEELKQLKKHKKELTQKVRRQAKLFKSEKKVRSSNQSAKRVKSSDESVVQDENMANAISNLQIIENRAGHCNEFTRSNSHQRAVSENATKSCEDSFLLSMQTPEKEMLEKVSIVDISDDDGKCDSDVIVVSPREAPTVEEISAEGSASSVDFRKPDLVNFDEKTESVTSEDFIVVPKCFDLETPLDESVIKFHQLDHQKNGTLCDDSCLWSPVIESNEEPTLMPPQDICASRPTDGLDLVASVPSMTRKKPDVTNPSWDFNLCMDNVDPIRISHEDNESQEKNGKEEINTLVEESNDQKSEHEGSFIEPITEQPLNAEASSSVVCRQPLQCEIPTPAKTPDVVDQMSTLNLQEFEGTKTPRNTNIIEGHATLLEQARAVSDEYNSVQITKRSSLAPEPLLEMSPPSPNVMKKDGTDQPTAQDGLNARGQLNDDEVPTIGDMVTDVLGTVIDATASAASAVAVTVGNVVSPRPTPPPRTVSYQDGQVQVNINPSVEQVAMDQLFEMGFCDRESNLRLLRQNNNDVSQCVSQLINMQDSNWYQTRH